MFTPQTMVLFLQRPLDIPHDADGMVSQHTDVSNPDKALVPT